MLDVRNAVGDGITVTGTPGSVATLSNDTTGDSFVVLSSNDSLTGERILAVTSGISLTDNGPELTVVIGISANGVDLDRLQEITAGFLGRSSGTGDVEELTGTQAAALIDLATTSLKGVVKKSTTIADLNQTITSPPTQGEVQDISDKIDALLAVMRTSGQLA